MSVTKILDKNYLLKNTGITTIVRGSGVIGGMMLDALVLAYFGLGSETAAFFAALAIPMLITATFENQVPKVLVPVITDSLAEDGQEVALDLIRSFITVSVIFLSLVCLLAMIFAETLIPMQVPGLQKETIRLSVSLSMFLCWLVLIRGIASIFQSVLYSLHHFTATSSNKVVTNTIAIVTLLIFHKQIGIHAVALGFILGGVINLGLLVVISALKGFRYRFTFRFRDKKLYEIFKLLCYPFIGEALSQARVLIENFLTSFMGAQSVSALRYASRIVSAVSGVLLSSVVTASLPLISHYYAIKDFEAMKQRIFQGFKLLTLIAGPICIWLAFVNKPMLILLFERGEFSRADVGLTSVIITLMIPYVFFTRMVGLMQMPFYASRDMRTPLLSGIMFLIFNVLSAICLFRFIGIYSLPVAASIAAVLTTLFLIFMFKQKFRAFGWPDLNTFLLRLTFVLLLTIIGFSAGVSFSSWSETQNIISKILLFVIPSLTGLITFAVSLFLFGFLNREYLASFIKSQK